MTALALVPRGRRRQRSFRLGVAIGLLLPVGLLLAFSLVSGGGSPETTSTNAALAARQRALSDFEDALEPITEAGAATVVYGMRPGINDINGQRFGDETLVGMAEGWVQAMNAVREDFAAVAVPEFLAGVAELYRQSFDEYVATAEALLDAARASGDARSEHINRAAAHGTRADELYNDARAELEGYRQAREQGDAG